MASNFMPSQDNVASELRDSVRRLLESRRFAQGEPRFTDTDENWGAGRESGTFASLQGLRTVAGALIALRDDPAVWSLVRPHVGSLLEEWVSILDSLDHGLRNCSPYSADKLQPILAEGTQGRGAPPSPYTDAVAWAVSTAVAINYVLPDLAKHAEVPADMSSRTRAYLVEALGELLSLQLSDGGWNWGRAFELESGHLYFTWSAMQGLADVFDYVFGESNEQIEVGRDQETTALLEGSGLAEKRLLDARHSALKFLDQRYLTAALEGRLDAELLSEKDAAGVVRIEAKSGQIPALYSFAYLQESLILGGYDAAGFPDGALKLRQLQDVIRSRFVAAQAWLKNPSRTPEELLEGSTATLTLRSRVKQMGQHHRYLIKDPCFWPQMLRVFVLFPYYVAWSTTADPYVIGPESAFDSLLADRIPEGDPAAGLWDSEAFNLAVTARAIEGLIDVLDYVERLDRPAAEPVESVARHDDLARVIADSIFPLVEGRLRAAKGAPAPLETPETPAGSAITTLTFETEFHQTLKLVATELIGVTEGIMVRQGSDDESIPPYKIDDLARKILGPARAKALAEENPEIYRLLQTFIGITFMTCVRGLPIIVQAAAEHLADATHHREIRKRRAENGEFISDAAKVTLRSYLAQLLETTTPPAGQKSRKPAV